MATHETPTLTAQTRDKIGSRYAARIRQQGQLPAVIYGQGKEPIHVALPGHELNELLHHNAHLIEIQLDGHREPCLIKEIQWDHLGSDIIHVDLSRVNMDEDVTLDVTVELTGEAVGLKEEGAYLEHTHDTISVTCRPINIPEVIHLDVSGLEAGHSITAGELTLPDGVVLASDPELIVASIQIQEELPEEEEAVESTDAEPEVIGRDAEEGESDDA